MQIVIDISEEEYNLIMLKQKVEVGGVTSEAEKYIAKGKPLPKGIWQGSNVPERFGITHRCSNCGYGTRSNELHNYCPNCGAEMESEE